MRQASPTPDSDASGSTTTNNGPARLLLNEVGTAARSLSIRLEGVESNRDGIGARVALLRADRDRVWRRVHRDGSYLSASDARVSFGLGDEGDAVVEGVGVVWPNGRRERWEQVDLDVDTRAPRPETDPCRYFGVARSSMIPVAARNANRSSRWLSLSRRTLTDPDGSASDSMVSQCVPGRTPTTPPQRVPGSTS